MSVLRSRLAPHFRLTVPFKSGKYGSRWSNKGTYFLALNPMVTDRSDLDPIPPDERTCKSISFSEMTTKYLWVIRGRYRLLGLLVLGHVSSSACCHRIQRHGSWFHCSRNNPHRLLRVCYMQCRDYVDWKNGSNIQRPISRYNSQHIWDVRILPSDLHPR